MMADDAQQRPIRRGMLARARGVWVVTAFAAIAVGVWIASFWFHAAWIAPNGTLVAIAKGDFYEVSFPAAKLLRAVPPSGEAIVANHGTPLWWSGYFGGPPLTVTTTGIALHWWALGIAAAWWGLIWWRVRHIRELHECWQCAYDRRGLATEMACPECGAPARAPTSA
jgi:hypothetical protein